jgi:tetratricopeptide (TPR) repeat protein
VAKPAEGPLARDPRLAEQFATIAKQHAIAVFAVASAVWVFFIYRRALGGQFLYDDVPQIVSNAALLSWRQTLGYFLSPVAFSSEYLSVGGSFYRPLLWLSLGLDRRIWGPNPVALHLVNMALHWLNGLLLFTLLRRTRVVTTVCAVASFIWLSVPINSEVIAWISGRYIAIFCLFLLLALLAADFYLQRLRWLYLVIYWVMAMAAMLSYEAGVLVLPLTLLWLYFKETRSGECWMWLSSVGLLALAADFVIRGAVNAQLPSGPHSIISAGVVFFKYLSWMVLPLQMSVERSTDMPADGFSLIAAAAWCGVIGLIAAAYYLHKYLPNATLGLAWLVLTVLPFCGIVPNYQGMAERYLYVASAGLTLVAASLFDSTRGRLRLLAGILMAAWFCWGTVRLQARLKDWKDEATLDRASLLATPKSAVLLFNLGVSEAQQGNLAAAEENYRRAITANPRHTSAMLNLGNVLRARKSYPEAIAVYQRLLQIDPEAADGWTNLGNVYGERGELEMAMHAYEQAARLKPESLEAAINLGTIFQRLGDYASARREYERAIAQDPRQAAAYCNLGALLFQQGDSEEAVKLLNRAIEINPSYATAYFDLGVIYQKRQLYRLAKEMYAKALEINPRYDAARSNMEAVRNE